MVGDVERARGEVETRGSVQACFERGTAVARQAFLAGAGDDRDGAGGIDHEHAIVAAVRDEDASIGRSGDTFGRGEGRLGSWRAWSPGARGAGAGEGADHPGRI